jgi:hypothetical protein
VAANIARVASSLFLFFVFLLSAWQWMLCLLLVSRGVGDGANSNDSKQIVVSSQILVPKLNEFYTKNKNY